MISKKAGARGMSYSRMKTMAFIRKWYQRSKQFYDFIEKEEVGRLEWVRSPLLGLTSAGLMTLSFPNFNIYLLAFVSLVPVFITIDRKNIVHAITGYLCFVIPFYAVFMSWTQVFHPFALPGIVLYMTGIYMLPLLVYRTLRGKYQGLYDPLLLAAIFTIFEYCRGLGFLRFPYGELAYTQYSFTTFIQITDITGYLGVSFLLYVSNAFIAQIVMKFGSMQKRWKAAAASPRRKLQFLIFNRVTALLFLLVSNLSYGLYQLRDNGAEYKAIATHEEINGKKYPLETFTATMIQPWFDYNITENRKALLSRKVFRLTDLAMENLQEETGTLPDLLIWPESTIDEYYEYELRNLLARREALAKDEALAKREALAEVIPETVVAKTLPPKTYMDDLYDYLVSFGDRYGVPLLSGGFAIEAVTKQLVIKDEVTGKPVEPVEFKTVVIGTDSYNAGLLIDKYAQVKAWMGKVYLVPFAEYFPYTELLERFPAIKNILDSANAVQFTAFEEYKIFIENNTPFAVMICYEDTFADLSRTYVLAGARFLIVITNDAWSYSVRSQNIHYAFSIFRAVENRRPLLRAGNAGVTTFIDAFGRPHETLDMFVEGYTTATFSPRTKLTWYTLLGDWMAWGLILFIIFFAGPLRVVQAIKQLIVKVTSRLWLSARWKRKT